MDIEFKSARELYMKVIPALNTKRRILNKKGINNCVRHVRHSSGGFVWIYSDPEEDAKYAENLKMLNTLGIKKMEEIKKQEKMSSTTISEKGVEQ